ncbi:MAG: hypothetical protein AB1491_00830 [Thermodesulfobacteriota bacterium]
MKWPKELLLSFALLIGSLIFLLGLIELGCRTYLYFKPAPPVLSRWEFRATGPPPYRNADYFNRDFLNESMRSVDVYRPPGKGYILFKDFQGKYFNITDGRRRTTGQPEDFQHRVLLFGGSAMFGQEVPDGHTIASYLQQILNERLGTRYKVENYGTVAMNAAQQTERLLNTPVHPGDIVIFYDGVNDAYYSLAMAYIDGWRPGLEHFQVKRLNWWQRRLHEWHLRYQKNSAAVRLLFDIYDRRPPATLVDKAILEQNLDKMAEKYRQSLIDAQQYVSSRGGKFYHFLQPNLIAAGEQTPYERELSQNYLDNPPGLDLSIKIGYPGLRKANKLAEAEGVKSFDLTQALEKRQPGEEFYLDLCHINHAGNKRIAQAIFDLVFSKGN